MQAQPFGPVVQTVPPVQPAYNIPAPSGIKPGSRSNGFGLAGMLLAIGSIVFFWFPYVGLGLAVLGLIMSIVGLARRGRGKGTSIAGLIIAIFGIGWGIIYSIAFAEAWERRQLRKTRVTTAYTYATEESTTESDTSDTDETDDTTDETESEETT